MEDDMLRERLADQIAATWHELACGSPPSCGQRNCEAGGSMPRAQALNLADALLPLIREHVVAAVQQRDAALELASKNGQAAAEAHAAAMDAEAAIERVRDLASDDADLRSGVVGMVRVGDIRRALDGTEATP